MDIQELLSTIIAGISLIALIGLGFWWLIAYGLKEVKETQEIRKLFKKWLHKQLGQDDEK